MGLYNSFSFLFVYIVTVRCKIQIWFSILKEKGFKIDVDFKIRVCILYKINKYRNVTDYPMRCLENDPESGRGGAMKRGWGDEIEERRYSSLTFFIQ